MIPLRKSALILTFLTLSGAPALAQDDGADPWCGAVAQRLSGMDADLARARQKVEDHDASITYMRTAVSVYCNQPDWHCQWQRSMLDKEYAKRKDAMADYRALENGAATLRRQCEERCL